jgi:hypothetical protein
MAALPDFMQTVFVGLLAWCGATNSTNPEAVFFIAASHLSAPFLCVFWIALLVHPSNVTTACSGACK